MSRNHAFLLLSRCSSNDSLVHEKECLEPNFSLLDSRSASFSFMWVCLWDKSRENCLVMNWPVHSSLLHFYVNFSSFLLPHDEVFHSTGVSLSREDVCVSFLLLFFLLHLLFLLILLISAAVASDTMTFFFARRCFNCLKRLLMSSLLWFALLLKKERNSHRNQKRCRRNNWSSWCRSCCSWNFFLFPFLAP